VPSAEGRFSPRARSTGWNRGWKTHLLMAFYAEMPLYLKGNP